MTRFSKSANACGVQSEGESMDEVTIALSCERICACRQFYQFVIITKRERQNPIHMKTKPLFG